MHRIYRQHLLISNTRQCLLNSEIKRDRTQHADLSESNLPHIISI